MIAAIGTAVTTVALSTAASAWGARFHWGIAAPSGDQVVPGPGDPDGFGDPGAYDPAVLIKAGFAGGTGGKIDSGDLAWLGVGEPTAIHIHRGGPGEAGPVFLELPVRFCPTCGPWAYATTTLPECKLLRFLKNPFQYYIDGHTAEFPDGAMRSQFIADPVIDPDGPQDEAAKEYRDRCKKK